MTAMAAAVSLCCALVLAWPAGARARLCRRAAPRAPRVTGWVASVPALWRRRRVGRELAAQVPGMLDLLAACVDAGLPIRTALAEVVTASTGAAADSFALVVRDVALGVPEHEAWGRLDDDPVLAEVARDVARAVIAGEPVSGVLRSHADDARRNAEASAVAHAKAVGVRSVLPMLLCFTPAFLLVGVVPIVAGSLVRLLG